eukprot:2275955-Pleurochrysis_carterae.AAC.6
MDMNYNITRHAFDGLEQNRILYLIDSGTSDSRPRPRPPSPEGGAAEAGTAPALINVGPTPRRSARQSVPSYTPCPIEGPFAALARSIDAALEGKSPLPYYIKAAVASNRFNRAGLDADSNSDDDFVPRMLSLDAVDTVTVSSKPADQDAALPTASIRPAVSAKLSAWEVFPDIAGLFDGPAAIQQVEAERASVEKGAALDGLTANYSYGTSDTFRAELEEDYICAFTQVCDNIPEPPDFAVPRKTPGGHGEMRWVKAAWGNRWRDASWAGALRPHTPVACILLSDRLPALSL